MSHLLFHVVKEDYVHLDILLHESPLKVENWNCHTLFNSNIRVTYNSYIGFSTSGRVIIVIRRNINTANIPYNFKPEINKNTIHYNFISSTMTIIQDEIKEKQYDVILCDGQNVHFVNSIQNKKLNEGLYLLCYYKYEISTISSHFEGWLGSLLYRNRHYDENLRQILLRVGYTYQFNRETFFTHFSNLMLVFVREKKLTVYRLMLKSLCLYYYNNEKMLICETCDKEKYSKFPSVFLSPEKYGYIYREYYLRNTFLPNPTSIKENTFITQDHVIRCFFDAYDYYSRDLMEIVENEYIKKNYNNRNGKVVLNVIDQDKINQMLFAKWKSEKYEIKHQYKMLSFIDKMRYYRESNKEFEKDQKMVEEEKDFIKKEELVSKICHLNQIFVDYDDKEDEEDKDSEFVIFYNESAKELLKEYSNIKLDDELGRIVYNEFMKNVVNDEEKLNQLREKFYKMDDIREKLDLINDDVIKYLPSRMNLEEDKKNKITVKEGKKEEKRDNIIVKEEKNCNDNNNDDGIKRKCCDNTCGSPIKRCKYSFEDVREILKELNIENEIIDN